MVVDLDPKVVAELRELAKKRDIGVAAGRVLDSTLQLIAATAGVPLNTLHHLSVVGDKLIATNREASQSAPDPPPGPPPGAEPNSNPAPPAPAAEPTNQESEAK